jgi:hypothetical protein
VYITCFWPIEHRVESELPENFQDIDFEDLEQQHVGFKEKVSLMHVVRISYSIYRNACYYCCQNCWNTYEPQVNHGNWLTFCRIVSLGDPSRRIFDEGVGIHEYLLCTILDCCSVC